MYTLWSVGDTDYQLRLTAGSIVQVERKLGQGLFTALNHLENFSTLLTLLWGALLPCQPKMKEDEAWEIYDRYVTQGGSFQELTALLLELLEKAGFIAPGGEKAAAIAGK